ncbi:MAG TPA: hypothetical protein VN452_04195 [Longilinea sp.]|nr:hypothetical protein [Longilinea sp.]
MTGIARETANERKNSDRLIFVLILVLVFLMAARTPLDTDLWWHLRAGEVTLQSAHPMLTDTLSFTREGNPWINHSWLSEVGMALLFRVGGYLALSAIVALVAAASMAVLYQQMTGPALLRAFVILLATLVAAVVWSPRPQILSLLLLAVCALILDDFRRKEINHLWLLPPLFVLWSNLHGGYPLGLGLIGAFMAGEFIDALFEGRPSWQKHWSQMRKYTILLVVCGLAVVVNPNGLNMWKIPFQTMSVAVLQNAIPEWASADFHDLVQQPFLWMIIAVFASFSMAGRRIDGADWITILMFGAAGLIARRNFGPFAMVAAPILSRYFWQAVCAICDANLWLKRRVSGTSLNRTIPKHLSKAINLSLMALIGFIAIIKLFVVSQPQFVNVYEQTLFPVDAVSWLKENPQKGNLFNSYSWGGYLTWAYPDKKVFVDGRTDLFGDKIIGDWLTVTEASQGWQDILDQWQIGTVLVEPDRPVVKVLSENGWRLLYRDHTAVIFQKDPAE